jgi:hypothetical protein
MSEADRRLIAFSIVGQCLFHHTHRPIAKLLAGEELYRSFDAARLADHITGFSLAALGLARPIGESAAPAACGNSAKEDVHWPPDSAGVNCQGLAEE